MVETRVQLTVLNISIATIGQIRGLVLIFRFGLTSLSSNAGLSLLV